MQITEALKPAAIEDKFHIFLLLAVILMSGSLALHSALPQLHIDGHMFELVGEELLQSAPYYS